MRIELALSGAAPKTLYFRDARRFGRCLVVRAGACRELPTLASLGPEPFDPAFTDAVFAASLARSRGPIKPLLLSQRIVAGLGGIGVVDEAALDRVGEGLIADPLVPVFSWQLTRHGGGSRAVAVFEDLEQVVALRVSRMTETEVVDDQELGASSLAAFVTSSSVGHAS